MNVAVFVGAPVLGGKGTSCALVKEYFLQRGVSCTHFSLGEALREKAKKDQSLAQILQTRELVSDDIVLRVLKGCVPKNGVVLYDGFPRNKFQATVALRLFEDKADWVTMSAHIRVPAEVVLNRLQSRIADAPERTDSTKESVYKGLGVYWSETVSAFDLLADEADYTCEVHVSELCTKVNVAKQLHRHINRAMNGLAVGAVLHSHTSLAVMS